jgi:RNA polymerase sigma-70 factor (ECF subfamily)
LSRPANGDYVVSLLQHPGDATEVEIETVDVASVVDLRRALARLDHEQRLVLVLRYYLDLPYEEIAATLGISAKAARTRVERAVHRLRPILQMREAII